MNTNKIQEIIMSIGSYEREIYNLERDIKTFTENGEEQERLVYSTLVDHDVLSLMGLQNGMDSFKHELITDNTGSGDLFYSPSIIKTTPDTLEDTRVEIREEFELVAWEDYSEKNIYMDLYCFVEVDPDKTIDGLESEIETNKVSVEELKVLLKELVNESV